MLVPTYYDPVYLNFSFAHYEFNNDLIVIIIFENNLLLPERKKVLFDKPHPNHIAFHCQFFSKIKHPDES